MGGKTYIPSANLLAQRLHTYLTRYQDTLIEGADTDKIAALADLLACLVTFIQKWPRPPVSG
jgi:hypothetical protein